MTKREFIESFVYYGIIAAIIYLIATRLLPIMMPFVIGFAIAYIAHKLSVRFTADMKKIQKIVILVMIYILLIVLIVLLSAYLVAIIRNFVTWVGGYTIYIEPTINEIAAAITEFSENLPTEVQTFMSQMTSALVSSLTSVARGTITFVTSLATNIIAGLPNTFVSIVVSIISSFYVLVDYSRVVGTINKWIPKKLKGLTDDLIIFTKSKLAVILKSYVIIMGITFLELAIGLTIIRIPNSILLALLISFLDILPVLGTGTILIPWSIVNLILGNFLRGFLLLGLYLIITVIRNIIEPKFVGGNLGLDPLTTLIAMIVGMRLLGFIGLFGCPLALSFVFFVKEKQSEEKKMDINVS